LLSSSSSSPSPPVLSHQTSITHSRDTTSISDLAFCHISDSQTSHVSDHEAFPRGGVGESRAIGREVSDIEYHSEHLESDPDSMSDEYRRLGARLDLLGRDLSSLNVPAGYGRFGPIHNPGIWSNNHSTLPGPEAGSQRNVSPSNSFGPNYDPFRNNPSQVVARSPFASQSDSGSMSFLDAESPVGQTNRQNTNGFMMNDQSSSSGYYVPFNNPRINSTSIENDPGFMNSGYAIPAYPDAAESYLSTTTSDNSMYYRPDATVGMSAARSGNYSRLSATAPEFRSRQGFQEPRVGQGLTSVQLVKAVLLGWSGQQESLILQQRLKTGTKLEKDNIVKAIATFAIVLSRDRYGNFLVQRCLEACSPENHGVICNALQGHIVELSTHPFACHVIQKAFDLVPEEYKASMVHELLRRIPETLMDKNGSHVWQKLLEIRWADAPPQIARYLTNSLRHSWNAVAKEETGSLVVQNIFENCLEDEKRECIDEILADLEDIAKGQWGNWVVQHLIENGSPADQQFVLRQVLRNAFRYSIGQYSSKVIEKCIKVFGRQFIEPYMEILTQPDPNRPRVGLVDGKLSFAIFVTRFANFSSCF
jgi:hypothetical protein